MSKIAAIALTMFAGVLMSIQPVVNGNLGKKVGTFESALVSFVVGGVALALIIMVWGKGNLAAVRTVPWYLLTGGLMGVVAVTTMLTVIPILGSGVGAVALLTGQMLTALLIDYYGFLGLQRIPISPARVIGVLLLFLGLRLITGKI